jgi:Ribonuclease G/E
MTKKMLIDAAHPEETRVVVVDGTRIEEFDFESQAKKQLRGNIYLAKVTRVEPSLQAAFIEYGGNRHGFLAFNEIHPDYYQIPLADREALLRAQAEEDDEPVSSRGRSRNAAPASEGDEDEDESPGGSDDEDDVVEEELARRRRRLMKNYKIQDVIRRRQIMLVQVVKEERGNKGAALTTYLSLAGRYGVLMPNTDRGGGISRKIVSATDRKRLKSVVQSLDVPKGLARRGPGLMNRHAWQIKVVGQLRNPVQPFGEGSVESVHEDKGPPLWPLFVVHRIVEVPAKVSLQGVDHVISRQEFCIRVRCAALPGPFDFAGRAVWGYGDVVSRQRQHRRPF